MEDSYNFLFQAGDRLIIELDSLQIFEGNYSDGGKNRIDLVNVKQHNNKNELGGVYSFYRNEIIKIYKHKSETIEKPPEQSKIVDVECNNIKMVEEEYNRLKEMCKDVIYLEQSDDRYFKAVEKISEAETVALISLGMEENSTEILRLLVISTWKQVYIFDLLNFRSRKIYPEIKDILESEYVTKVMHGGSSLINTLQVNYNVYVHNVFDTQIVDLVLEKSKSGSCPKTTLSIAESLVKYLNFPPPLLKDAMLVSKKKWTERPLSDENKFFASQLVTYLIPLKEHMMKQLLLNVYKTIDDVHNWYCNLDNYECARIKQKNSVTTEIDNLIPVLSSSFDLKEANKDETEINNV